MVQVHEGLVLTGICDPKQWGLRCGMLLLQLRARFDQNPLSMGTGIP